MASVSSQTSGLSTKYDVFVNFMGEDIYNGFAVFLQKDLKREGVEVFINSKDLWDGEEIQPTLLQIIRRSKIWITVFSSDYAESKSCLSELEEIVRWDIYGPRIVLPVFLDVEPRDVRNQTGRFGKSFQKHLEIFDAQKIKTWKDALRTTAEIKGLELQQINGDLSRLEEILVKWVLRQRIIGTIRPNYDVFISSNDKDTGKNFTAFLQKDLKRVGLKVCMDVDVQGFSFGDSIGERVVDAIHMSKIAIIVFSKHYADSTGRLYQLAKIFQCNRRDGQITIPIFLDVGSDDVRHQSGTFERSFQDHQKNLTPPDIVTMWKHVLTEVGGMSGFDLGQVDGNQPRLVNLVVYEVLSKLDINSRGLNAHLDLLNIFSSD